MKQRCLLGLLAALATSACTTLGPMPATTGIAAVPVERPGVELQGGLAPGYFLSEATQSAPSTGDPSRQLSAVIEPDRWLGLRGVIAGLRGGVTPGSDRSVEPLLGYRERIDDSFSLAVVGHGTVIRGSDRGASYRASRIGGEIALDVRLFAPAPWLELHGQITGAAVYLDATGTYCVGATGFGVDCSQSANDHMVDGTVRGVFPAATGSVAVDIARGAGVFHGTRIALFGTTGMMPRLRDGMATGGARYQSAGLTLTVGFGER